MQFLADVNFEQMRTIAIDVGQSLPQTWFRIFLTLPHRHHRSTFAAEYQNLDIYQ